MGDADVPVPVLESAPVPRACGTGFLVAVGRPGDRRSAVGVVILVLNPRLKHPFQRLVKTSREKHPHIPASRTQIIYLYETPFPENGPSPTKLR